MAADWLSDYAAQKAKEDAEDWRKHQQKEDLAGLGWLGLRKVESVLGSAIDGLFGWLDKGINTAWAGAGELIERGINWLQGQGFRTGLEIATQAALKELHRMGVEEATKAAVAEFGKQQMQDVLDKFYKDSRETTNAKIYALKQAGYDTTQLEAEVQKRRQAIEEAKKEQLDKKNIEVVQIKEAGIFSINSLLKIFFGKEEEKIVKGVQYHSQRDNTTKDGVVNGHNMCQLTSLAMVMEHKGIEIGNGDKQYEDKLYEIAKKLGMGGEELWKETRDVYQSIIEYLNKENKTNYGINVLDEETVKTRFEDFAKSLIDQNIPVIASGNFPNGHVIVIVGYDKEGWIAHDPYGDANTKYKNTNGMYVRYKYGDFYIGKKWFAYIK